MFAPVSPLVLAQSLTGLWSPRVVAELDDSYVKVAKIQGTLAWHSHDDEDELFYVLKGSMRIEMEAETIVLKDNATWCPGEYVITPWPNTSAWSCSSSVRARGTQVTSSRPGPGASKNNCRIKEHARNNRDRPAPAAA